MNTKTQQLLTLLAAIGMFALVIYSVNVAPSGQNPTYSIKNILIPAGYTFSIWSIIYLGLLGFAVYQVLPAQQDNPRLEKTRKWAILNFISNGLWLIAANNGLLWLTVLLIIIMLISLIKINEALEISKTKVSRAEVWAARIPFSMYYSWVTIATALNIAVFLQYNGWQGGGLSEEFWAVSVLTVAMIITTFVCLRYSNFIYMLVVVWATAGIYVANQGKNQTMIIASLIALSIAIIISIIKFIQSRKTNVFV